jgi:hypothetical protein
MSDVILAFGKHEILLISANDAHILDPRAGENWIARVASPVDAIG